jgi:hypothetical protein
MTREDSTMTDTEILGLRVRLTRTASLLTEPTTQRPDQQVLVAALREVVDASESALGRLERAH